MLRHPGLLVVIAGSMAIIGCSDMGNPIRPKAEALLSSAALDFGVVAVTGVSTRTLTVRNSGTATLSGNAAVSCNGYQLIEGGGAFSIAPGASRAFVVRFSPSVVGSFPCTLELGPNAPSVPITGAGAVQVPGALSFIAPDSLDFGTAMVGQVKTGAVVPHVPHAVFCEAVPDLRRYPLVDAAGISQRRLPTFFRHLHGKEPELHGPTA